MTKQISWLHITDLHLGLDDSGWLWPKLRRDFHNDLRQQLKDLQGLDIVFFTGDLTQSGSEVEFARLAQELEVLWKIFTDLGFKPVFCPVPGNHDLRRLTELDPIAKALSLWESDSEIRREFWQNSSSDYRNKINESFRPYDQFLATVQVPTLPRRSGVLPGDFAGTLDCNGLKLAVVGLNSTFLQLTKGNYKNRIDLHVSQLNAVCFSDPHPWLEKHDGAVLLTHHPPSWLSTRALGHFRDEIYPPGRFLSHFCGHMHEPETTDIAEAGGAPRRTRQGPSLFGLETWEGGDAKDRLHGYVIGQLLFEGKRVLERFWPRRALKGRNGVLRLKPDHTFELTDDDCVTSTLVHEDDPSPEPFSPPNNKFEIIDSEELLLEKPDTSRLSGFPRLALSASPHHKAIRLEEQSQFEHDLRKTRATWIVADWGVGRDGFISASLDRFGEQPVRDVYVINCDESPDFESLENAFKQQFGVTLQEFAVIVAQTDSALLVFDDLHPSLVTDAIEVAKCKRTIEAVLDFCTKLRIVVSSRQMFAGSVPAIELLPLEGPDVRTYVEAHPDGANVQKDVETIEKLFERSDGLPMHLDRMLRALRISSLEAVMEAELERSASLGEDTKNTPKALIHAVAQLAHSTDKPTRRSMRLLKVLSMLPYGETLERLRYFLPTDPFYLDNAIQLNESALLEILPVQLSHASVGSLANVNLNSPKILKIPRQVRDYVHTLLTEDERMIILEAGAERLLGPKWREGTLKLRPIPVGQPEHSGGGASNEFWIIHALLVTARDKAEVIAVRRLAKIAVSYTQFLLKHDRYRDLVSVSEHFLQVIDRVLAKDSWSQLTALYGQALRMVGNHKQAIIILHAVLDVEDTLSNSSKASIWLDVALAEESIKNVEGALAAAEEVKKLTHENTSQNLLARSVIANLQLKDTERTAALVALEKKAREHGAETVASTITLNLASETKDIKQRLAVLDRIPQRSESGYQTARIVIARTKVLQVLPDYKGLKLADMRKLSQAYAYLYAQRFSRLFDDCHESLWEEYERENDISKLVGLFRFSSLVWRIRGEEEQEAEYATRLNGMAPSHSSAPVGLVQEFKYFMRRVKIVIVGAFKGDAG